MKAIFGYFYYFLMCILVRSSSLLIKDLPLQYNDYTLYNIEDKCPNLYNYKLGATNISSSFKLIFHRKRDLRNCSFNVIPPKGYGVIIHIEDFYFGPYKSDVFCNYTYLKISGDGLIQKHLCGKTPIVNTIYTTGIASFCYFGLLQYIHARLTLAITAYKTECSSSEPNLFKCSNGNCIWDGLVRDGINNCGDNSDEVKIVPTEPDDFQEIPGFQTQPLIYAVSAILTTLTLIITITACRNYIKSRSIAMSQNRGYIPTERRIFSNFNSNFQDSELVHTPPPTYDTVMISDWKNLQVANDELPPPPYAFIAPTNLNENAKQQIEEEQNLQ